jgi:hypothetical protein
MRKLIHPRDEQALFAAPGRNEVSLLKQEWHLLPPALQIANPYFRRLCSCPWLFLLQVTQRLIVCFSFERGT